MSMKKQPEGITRKPHGEAQYDAETGKKIPPSMYDIFLGETILGYTERQVKGKWRATPPTAPSQDGFKNHTEAVEWLLGVHRGLENVSDTATSAEAEAVSPEPDTTVTEEEPSAEQETAEILADPETMAAIKEAVDEGEATIAAGDKLVTLDKPDPDGVPFSDAPSADPEPDIQFWASVKAQQDTPQEGDQS